VPGLDGLLGGGYTPGSTIVAAGLSGTFKTTLALHFALTGPAPALWIGFHEDGAALRRTISALAGPAPAAPIDILESVPGRDPIEKLLLEAERRIAERGAARVIVDGMNELTADLDTEAERDEAAAWFLRRLRALGVTTLLTQRLARVVGLNPLSEIAHAELADTIVYLGLVEIESRLEKVISVLKHRGGMTEGDLRSIRADAHGLRVSERFVGLSGVLAGTPLGRRKAQIEEIFQPLYFIRDFLALAGDPAMDPAQRAAVLDQIGGETRQLIALLSRYFDQAPPGTGAATHGD
jgi:circadian clock protein KaiC